MKKIFYGMLLLPLVVTPVLANSDRPVYGPTLENEHLYRIALRVRPTRNLTVQQVMIALLNENPNAFAKSNINFLKSGYRLVIPDMTEIAKISAKTAWEQVDLQNKAWSQGAEPLVAQTKIQAVPESKEQLATNEARPFTAFFDIASHHFNPEVETTMTSLSATDADQLATLVQNTQRFEQQTTAELASLKQHNQDLETKVAQLNEQLKTMTYHFIQLSTYIKNQDAGGYGKAVLKNLIEYGWGLGGSLIALALLLWAYARSGKNRHSTKQSKPEHDEYDFLQGKESIPTKLDLARAYIDMGDDHAAQSTLKDVLQKGDENQQQIARDLMGKLNLGL